MTQGTCSIEGCGRATLARGWCRRHYLRWHRTGDPLGREGSGDPFPDNLLARMEPQPNGCIWFTGALNSEGYGVLQRLGRRVYAHRAAFEHFVGPIPEGTEIDHECHNADTACEKGRACPHRRCVNVEHLRTVSHKENVASGRKPGPKTEKPRLARWPKGDR